VINIKAYRTEIGQEELKKYLDRIEKLKVFPFKLESEEETIPFKFSN